MNRTFSVIRRRNHLVDLMTPFVYGIQTYRLKWNVNFDGAFAQFLDSSNVGYLDPSINPAVVEAQPSRGQVRVVFDPSNYAITDTGSFWLELWHVPVGGGPEVQMSAPTLVLPESSHHGVGSVTIHGTAPIGASSANSLQLDLPRLMSDFRIHNEEAVGGHALFVSSEEGGPESRLDPDTFPQFQQLTATQGSLWVRGGGGTAAFSAVFTLAFPR